MMTGTTFLANHMVLKVPEKKQMDRSFSTRHPNPFRTCTLPFFLMGSLMDPASLKPFLCVLWYIHHRHHPLWYQPRVLELEGHWRRWATDIAEGWRDLIRLDEGTTFYLFHPDPPRAVGQHQEIYYDLIVTQGLDLPLRAGLITVLRANDRAARADFAVAASLPSPVSGVYLADRAQVSQRCQMEGGRIWYDHAEIPFTNAAVHAT